MKSSSFKRFKLSLPLHYLWVNLFLIFILYRSFVISSAFIERVVSGLIHLKNIERVVSRLIHLKNIERVVSGLIHLKNIERVVSRLIHT